VGRQERHCHLASRADTVRVDRAVRFLVILVIVIVTDRQVDSTYNIFQTVVFVLETIPLGFTPFQPPHNSRASSTTTTTATKQKRQTSMFTILASAALAASLARASALPHVQPTLEQRQTTNSTNSTIQWQPCAKAPAPSECALFVYVFTLGQPKQQQYWQLTRGCSVPLDYAKPAAGTTQIAMIRYPAQKTPRKGSMFMNPGPHVRNLSCLPLSLSTFQVGPA
jgi:hypothetical protein